MKNSFQKWSVTGVTPLIALCLLFSACLTDPHDEHGHDHDHDHEVYGLAIYNLNNDETDTVIIKQTLDGVSGTILINEQTSLFELLFLDDDDHEFLPDLSEHTIEIASNDGGNLLKIEQLNGDDQENQFSLTGIKSGTTDLTVTLKHQGAKEFVSKPLPTKIDIQE